MFQFFKNIGQRDKSGLLKATSTTSANFEIFPRDACNGSTTFIQTPLGVLCDLEEETEEEILNDDTNNKVAHIYGSQLSKALPEILTDKNALGYFIQFMDTRKHVALIKFWLEMECLCSAFGMPNNIKELRCSNRKRTPDTCSITSVNNDENFHSNNLANDTDTQVNSRISFEDNENVDSNDVTCNLFSNSNNDNDSGSIPKTSQMVKEIRQSNRNCENKNYDMITKQDALKIYRKYILKEALNIHQISDELKLNMARAIENDNIEPILQCLSTVQSIVYDILENEYINDFLRSEFYCKHQIDVLTSGNVQLADILYNETVFFYFMEFMELENKRELLDFWMSANSYKQNILDKNGAVDPEEVQSDAVIIYEKYFSLQATMPLGFSDKIRFHVEQNICCEDEGGPQSDCFDKPSKIIYNFLNKHYLPSFLSSQLYYKYLSELISTIQSNSCPSLHPKIKRTGSDCSSEISSVCTSTPSTSQMENSKARLSDKKKDIKSCLNIDTRQLYDPDSLWKRNKYSLNIGYIDNLGRFIPQIESDPRRKYESRLTRAIKRFVNIEQDKAKEELAWKITEMIIREITSLTLGTSNLPS